MNQLPQQQIEAYTKSLAAKSKNIGVFAAFVGTAFVTCAEMLPEANPLKIWLYRLTPGITIGVHIFSFRIRGIVRRYRFNKWIEKAKKTLEEEIRNSNTTPEQKVKLMKDLKELQDIKIEDIFNQIHKNHDH